MFHLLRTERQDGGLHAPAEAQDRQGWMGVHWPSSSPPFSSWDRAASSSM